MTAAAKSVLNAPVVTVRRSHAARVLVSTASEAETVTVEYGTDDRTSYDRGPGSTVRLRMQSSVSTRTPVAQETIRVSDSERPS